MTSGPDEFDRLAAALRAEAWQAAAFSIGGNGGPIHVRRTPTAEELRATFAAKLADAARKAGL